MGARFTKQIPEFIYFVGEDGNWISGPYVRPQAGRNNRKFKIIEVTEKDSKKKK